MTSTRGVVAILDHNISCMELGLFVIPSEQSTRDIDLYTLAITFDAHARQGPEVAVNAWNAAPAAGAHRHATVSVR